MKKATVKNSPKREANKFAGLKTPKKRTSPKQTETGKKREWWRRPEEPEQSPNDSTPSQ